MFNILFKFQNYSDRTIASSVQTVDKVALEL